jgi:predicted RNA-binding protein (virulence factor B family)
MEIGQYCNLKVVRESPYGLFLSDGEDEVLLPENQCPDDALVGNSLKVFLYTDSEDRRIATRMKPKAVVGEFAYLECVSVSRAGAFFDWGLLKDLFCPFKEQLDPVREGEWHMVHVYLDVVTQRVVCSTKLRKFLSQEPHDYQVGDPVRIQILDQGPSFMSVLIDGKYRGALFSDEWVTRLDIGQKIKGFIKMIRPGDGKIAVSLRPQGLENVLGERDRLLRLLEQSQGVLPFSDKSDPNAIQSKFGMSKGSFKKLIGNLYRDGLIEIHPNEIRLKK